MLYQYSFRKVVASSLMESFPERKEPDIFQVVKNFAQLILHEKTLDYSNGSVPVFIAALILVQADIDRLMYRFITQNEGQLELAESAFNNSPFLSENRYRLSTDSAFITSPEFSGAAEKLALLCNGKDVMVVMQAFFLNRGLADLSLASLKQYHLIRKEHMSEHVKLIIGEELKSAFTFALKCQAVPEDKRYYLFHLSKSLYRFIVLGEFLSGHSFEGHSGSVTLRNAAEKTVKFFIHYFQRDMANLEGFEKELPKLKKQLLSDPVTFEANCSSLNRLKENVDELTTSWCSFYDSFCEVMNAFSSSKSFCSKVKPFIVDPYETRLVKLRNTLTLLVADVETGSQLKEDVLSSFKSVIQRMKGHWHSSEIPPGFFIPEQFGTLNIFQQQHYLMNMIRDIFRYCSQNPEQSKPVLIQALSSWTMVEFVRSVSFLMLLKYDPLLKDFLSDLAREYMKRETNCTLHTIDLAAMQKSFSEIIKIKGLRHGKEESAMAFLNSLNIHTKAIYSAVRWFNLVLPSEKEWQFSGKFFDFLVALPQQLVTKALLPDNLTAKTPVYLRRFIKNLLFLAEVSSGLKPVKSEYIPNQLVGYAFFSALSQTLPKIQKQYSLEKLGIKNEFNEQFEKLEVYCTRPRRENSGTSLSEKVNPHPPFPALYKITARLLHLEEELGVFSPEWLSISRFFMIAQLIEPLESAKQRGSYLPRNSLKGGMVIVYNDPEGSPSSSEILMDDSFSEETASTSGEKESPNSEETTFFRNETLI